MASVVDASKYLTLVGVIAAFISSLMAHGFLTLSRKVQKGACAQVVARVYNLSFFFTLSHESSTCFLRSSPNQTNYFAGIPYI